MNAIFMYYFNIRIYEFTKIYNTCFRNLDANAKCHNGYTLPDGSTSIMIKCKNNSWVYPDHLSKSRSLHCSPNCNPLCKNGGICIGPNKCQCPGNTFGEKCEIKSECLPFIPGIQPAIINIE